MQEMSQRERTLHCLRFEPADRLCLSGSFRPEVWSLLETHFETLDRKLIARKLGLGFQTGVDRNPDPRWLEGAQATHRGVAIPNFFRWGWELRGMEEFFCDIASQSRELTNLLDRLEEYHIELARRYGQAGVDMLNLWGDLAMQTTTFLDPALWRRHFKPRTARVIETARKHGVRYVYLHSDGNLMPILDDLVEVGVNVIDPVQPECMDPAVIRERFPGLVLHGTISSQRTLPFGSVEDVEREVRDRIERCGRRNGLVLGPNNVVQFDVPLENLFCLYDTARRVRESFYEHKE